MVNPRFVIKAVISGQRLNINVPLTVSGAVNYIGVEAKFTSEWNDCTIVCYILQPSTGYYAQLPLIYDEERNLYYFPNSERLILSAGEWDIWFVGIIAQSGQEVYRVTTETKIFTVYENYFEKRLPDGNITLDEQAIAKATDAQNKANLILDLYNQGKLVGPKGDPGDPAKIGYVQASVDNTTNNPACVVTVIENPENNYNMQFAFSGIKGAKGDKGDTGEKGDAGAPGTTIDDYVLVQAEQPTSETNKMWLKPTASTPPVMIPSVEEFENAGNQKAPVIIDNAYGAIANFEDGADGLAIKTLTVNIKPLQAGSGDPSPQNVRAISGWTGASIYREAVYDSSASPIVEIPFPTPPGTVYGGTLTINDDGTGELIVDKEFISLDGSAQWVEVNPNSGKFYANAIPENSAKVSADYISNLYLFAGNGATKSSDVTIDKRFYGQRSYGRFWVYNSDYSNNLAGFKAALNATPLQIVYPLTNPLSYTLTAAQITTLLGTNNIWADCGSVSVDYRADTKLYIQKINTPTDEDMVADSQIASGKYFLINNTLYLSTTTIPAGDTIIPGTNCTKTNLAAALNALNT